MIDWRRVLVEVATRGGFIGLSRDEITSLMTELYPMALFDAVVMDKVWKRLVGFAEIQLVNPETKEVVEKPGASEDFLLRIETSLFWEQLIVGGRAVKLSHFSISLLEVIGRAGPNGIPCPDLGAQIKMDPRNLHYHLQPLQTHSLMYTIALLFEC